MSQDLRDLDNKPKIIDVDGERFILVPEKGKEIKDESGFTTYDTTYGHCTFCGRLNCNETCFK